MGSEKRIAVALALTPDPALLPVVQGLAGGLAEQLGFGESQRLNLQQGIVQACRGLMEVTPGKDGAEVRLEFTGFADRLEVVLEDGGGGAGPSEENSFLLAQVLDRVSVEEVGDGRLRLTLVQYLSSAGSQP